MQHGLDLWSVAPVGDVDVPGAAEFERHVDGYVQRRHVEPEPDARFRYVLCSQHAVRAQAGLQLLELGFDQPRTKQIEQRLSGDFARLPRMRHDGGISPSSVSSKRIGRFIRTGRASRCFTDRAWPSGFGCAKLAVMAPMAASRTKQRAPMVVLRRMRRAAFHRCTSLSPKAGSAGRRAFVECVVLIESLTSV